MIIHKLCTIAQIALQVRLPGLQKAGFTSQFRHRLWISTFDGRDILLSLPPESKSIHLFIYLRRFWLLPTWHILMTVYPPSLPLPEFPFPPHLLYIFAQLESVVSRSVGREFESRSDIVKQHMLLYEFCLVLLGHCRLK